MKNKSNVFSSILKWNGKRSCCWPHTNSSHRIIFYIILYLYNSSIYVLDVTFQFYYEQLYLCIHFFSICSISFELYFLSIIIFLSYKITYYGNNFFSLLNHISLFLPFKSTLKWNGGLYFLFYILYYLSSREAVNVIF